MRKLIFLIFAASLLLLGCVQQGAEAPQVTEHPSEGAAAGTTEQGATTGTQAGGEECESSYSFSELEDGVLSQETLLVANARCAGGKTIALYIDDEAIAQQAIATNNPATLNFMLVPKSEGTREVKVKADGETVYSSSWAVAPLGSQDISGTRNDAASVKEWIGTAFDVETTITAKRVGAYMRRLESETLQNSYIVAEIRPDANGEPGPTYTARTTIPVTKPTLSYNWIWFTFDGGALLQPGRYWVVFKVEQETENIISDAVNIHYVAADTQSPPNDYTRKMTLVWDNTERRYMETTWQPLGYDRTYAVVISGLDG